MYITKSVTFRTDHNRLSEVIESFDGYPTWNSLVRSLKLTEKGAVREGAKVQGTLDLGGRERKMKGRITTYNPHRQLVLNFSSLFYRVTIDYSVQWLQPEGRDVQGVPEGESNVTVKLSFTYESGMPVIGSLLDEFAKVNVSEESLRSSLEGLKAHAGGSKTA